MAFDKALQALAAIGNLTVRLFSELSANQQLLKKAQEVSRVFELYESRLRARAESELTNTQRDLLSSIT